MADDAATVLGAAVDRLRQRGNEAYAAGKPADAVSAYSEALRTYRRACPHDNVNDAEDAEVEVGVVGRLVAGLGLGCLPTVPRVAVGLGEQQLDRATVEAVCQPHVLLANRSAAFIALRRPDEALRDARDAVLLRPDWHKAHLRHADALLLMRRYSDARSVFQHALSLASDEANVEVLSKRVLLCSVKEDEEEEMLVVVAQLHAGLDFAISSWSPIASFLYQFARMLQNFIYIVACKHTKQCFVIDACWDIDAICNYVQQQGWHLTAAIVTHYHTDHVGGKPQPPYDKYYVKVDGLVKLMRRLPALKAYIHQDELAAVKEANEDLDLSRVVLTHDNFPLSIGSMSLRFLHTPGHTPGSQCVLLNGKRLFSGDTLFIRTVGRVDFPDADARKLFDSLQKLKQLDAKTVVYPGHNYGGTFTTIEEEQKTGFLYHRSFETFMAHI